MSTTSKTTSRLVVKRRNPALQHKFAPPNPLEVADKDPEYTYRWIRYSDNTMFVNGQDHRGWEIVRNSASVDSESTYTGNLSQFSKSELGNLRRHGGLILARMPKWKSDARNDYYAELARKQVAAKDDPRHDVERKDRKHFIESTYEKNAPGLRPMRGQARPRPARSIGKPLVPMTSGDSEE